MNLHVLLCNFRCTPETSSSQCLCAAHDQASERCDGALSWIMLAGYTGNILGLFGFLGFLGLHPPGQVWTLVFALPVTTFLVGALECSPRLSALKHEHVCMFIDSSARPDKSAVLSSAVLSLSLAQRCCILSPVPPRNLYNPLAG